MSVYKYEKIEEIIDNYTIVVYCISEVKKDEEQVVFDSNVIRMQK